MVFNCTHTQHQSCIINAINNAEALCEKKNIKLTKLRKRILELIWGSHTPRKAYDLLTEFQKEEPAAKPSTIYRTLDFLQEHGFIHRLNRCSSYIGCVNPEQTEPYFLLFCSNCNNVKESNYREYQIFFDQIFTFSQFQCSNKVFEIEGTCSNCL